jgi:hypothetical protein
MPSSDRVPFIEDPAHLREVAGTAYVCLRPTGDVVSVYEEVQGRLRASIPGLSFPRPHCSLKGFGTADWRVDEERLVLCASVVAAVARALPQLDLSADGLGTFEEVPIPFVRIRPTASLELALRLLRDKGSREDCPGVDDRISPGDWVFHLSLAYPTGNEDAHKMSETLDEMSPPSARCTVTELELVFFDGGPERLVEVFQLEG